MNETEPSTAIQYPCDFSIKVMGASSAEFEIAVLSIIRRHTTNIKEDGIKSRLSKGGKYLALTITITAESQAQMDAIYQELSACEEVLMAL